MPLSVGSARSVRLVATYPRRSRERNRRSRAWVLGYQKHPILHAEWLYMDLEPRT